MPTDASLLAVRERAEVSRSAKEAAAFRPQPLPESVIQRYLTPPASTPYHLEYAFHLAGDLHGQRVLDLGCGTGGNATVLARRGATVIGCDLSHELVAQAAAVSRGPQFLVGSAHQIPLPDASVDLVFGMMILHHLDLDLSAAEIRRVLKPGGRAIFAEPVRTLKTIQVLRKCIPYTAPNVSEFERPLTEGEVRHFARGFRALTTRAFNLPLVSLLTILRSPALDLWYRLDGWLLRYLPWLSPVASVRVFSVVK